MADMPTLNSLRREIETGYLPEIKAHEENLRALRAQAAVRGQKRDLPSE